MNPREGKTPGGGSGGGPGARRSQVPMIPGGWIWAIVIIGILALALLRDQFTGAATLPYGVFKEQIAKKNVKDVRILPSKITGELLSKDPLPDELKSKMRSLTFRTNKPNVGVEDLELMPMLAKYGISHDLESDSMSVLGPFLIWFVLPMLFLLALLLIFLPKLRDPLGGGFLSSYIKSPARKYEGSKQRITFNDVAGMENAKMELTEVVDFLRNPEKYKKLGGQIPKGVLLVGPPGTGKTLLARATAGEAGVPFYSIGGSEFIQMFVGVGASRVRDLFKTARESAPCILFIDEIDAVGRVRGAGLGGGHDEREQTLNQILSEMDGFLPTESVIVLAATNRPDVLDPALLRPGRFDRHVTIDRPTWQGRLAILKVHTRDKPLADDVDLAEIARAMIGMTGADLRNLANEAALIATRENKSKITRTDFLTAADRILIGAKREEVLTPEEKKRTAYHEAGHALAAIYEPHSDPVHKLTIIPRGQALGVTRLMPEEDRYDHTQEQLMARLVMTMGGRAADRLVYNTATSGAAMDLKQATRIARLMVTNFGMSNKLGPVAYRVGEEHVFLGKEIQEARDFSEGTAQVIDEEVRRLLGEADQRAYEHLKTHRDKLDLLVEYLLQREELTRPEIEQLLATGKLPPQEVPVEKKPQPQPAEARSTTTPAPEPAIAPIPAVS
jgi:cell division protease FtsH